MIQLPAANQNQPTPTPQIKPVFLAMAAAVQSQLAQQQKPNGPTPSDSEPSAA